MTPGELRALGLQTRRRFRGLTAEYSRPHLRRCRGFKQGPALYECRDRHDHVGIARTVERAYDAWVIDVQYHRFALGYFPAQLTRCAPTTPTASSVTPDTPGK